MPKHRNWSLVCLWLTVFLVGCTNDPYRGWVDVVETKHKFRIKMPVAPKKESEKSADGREIAAWDSGDGSGKGFPNFKVMVSPAIIAEDFNKKDVLVKLQDSNVTTFKGKLLNESDYLRQGKTFGRRFEQDSALISKRIRSVFILHDGVFYDLSVAADSSWAGWPKAERFFDSFELLP